METTNQTHLPGVNSKRRIRSAKEMYPIVETWMQSNQSQKSFCEEQGIKMHLLSYWARRYEQENNEGSLGQESAMIPLEIESGNTPDTNYAIEIIYPSGVRLRFGQMIDLSTLQFILPKR